MDTTYSKGTRVWLPHKDSIWQTAVVLSTTEEHITCQLQDGSTTNVPIEEGKPPPHLVNPDILVGSDDLTDLSHLHEPAVVHNLQVRFKQQQVIYTYCGIVLVAINPYSSLPIYSNDIIHAYHGRTMGELDPHIFAVAEEAFRCMGRHKMNQSIIVSGESGAGKTVSAKYTMRYFATVGGAEAETQIEKKVLASNPVMEAIGNAKTIRNDNSSRFGKYIEILFNERDHIIGAEMRTYLLEKSRVVFQAENERNYHIFYQLCASQDSPELETLELSDPDEFHYTKQGGNMDIDNVDDKEEFQRTKEALSLLGVSDESQAQIFAMLGAILHLGNVEIRQRSRRREDAFIPEEDTHLPIVCSLLGIDPKLLSKWITHRKIQTGREVFTKPQTVENALRARDALAKHIYSHIFDWLVSRINESLAHRTKMKAKKFIGVLDIYGFETFQVNSFEQFCINYANEKLQQQFNMHVFKLEQDEYVKEKIEWSFIDFYDNQPCIDLIEAKFGILSLLDEETLMPKGNDDNWCVKLYSTLESRHHFKKPRLSNTAFIVKHYADDVSYEVKGFMEKNKDTIYEEHLVMLRSSTVHLVSAMFSKEVRQGSKKATVGSQFKDSLAALMQTLNETTPHYVRCIKPNDAKEAFEVTPSRLVQQLRACGVLETIRISAAGYPSRWAYDEFHDRYSLLSSAKALKGKEGKAACEAIIAPLIEDRDKYQFGATKLFFRAGQVAYLEKLRATKLRESAIRIQACIRRWLAHTKYIRISTTARALQTYGRGYLARKLAQSLREGRAATAIQACVRGFLARKLYNRTLTTVVWIQSCYRRMVAQKELKRLQETRAADLILRALQMFHARKEFVRKRNAAITIQCGIRCVLAKRKLKKLKVEARSVAGMKERTVGLEKKIMELQQTMDRRIQEVKDEKDQLIAQLQDQLACVQSQESSALEETASELTLLRAQNETLKADLAAVTEEKESMEQSFSAQIAAKQKQLDASAETIKVLEETATESSGATKEVEAAAKRISELERLNSQLESELVDERTARQLKLQSQSHLEAKVASLEKELQESALGALRSAHDLSDADLQRISTASQPTAAHDGSLASTTATSATASNTLQSGSSEEIAALQNELASLKAAYDTLKTTSEEEVAEITLKMVELERENTELMLAGEEFTASERRGKKDLSQKNAEDPDRLSHQPEAGVSFESDESETKVGGGKDDEYLEVTVNSGEEDNSTSDDAEERPLAMQKAVREDQDDQDDQDERHGAISAGELREQLGQASTNIKRLQLANTMLNEKVIALEKAKVAAEAKLKRLYGENVNLDELRGTVAEQQEEIAALRRENEMLVPMAVLDDAREEYNALHGKFVQLQQEYTLLLDNPSVEELAKMKTVLEQKNTAMEDELRSLKSRVQDYEHDLATAKAQIKDMVEDKQQTEQRTLALKHALSKQLPDSSPSSNSDGALLQEEIRLLIDENLSMREKVEGLEDQLRAALENSSHSPSSPSSPSDEAGNNDMRARENGYSRAHPSGQARRDGSSATANGTGRKRMLGMLKFQEKDTDHVASALVTKLEPSHVRELMPCIPAHLIFMCVLYADHEENASMLQAFLTKAMTAIKDVVQNHAADLDRLAFWLANGYRLLSNMKQFSGEPQFASPNDNESASLTTFDLQEYRIVLSDLLVQVYHFVVKHIEHQLQNMIVPGMLEHESLPTSSFSSTPSRRRGARAKPSHKVDDILKLLSRAYEVIEKENVEPKVTRQVFHQLFHIINATMCNNLLLRKDLVRLTKGMQVRYNISKLEDWAREHQLEAITTSLEEVVQITQLLQCNKTRAEDIDTIFETCTKLKPLQIQKVLQMYTPEDFEERVPASLIRAAQARVTADPNASTKLLLDTSFMHPVTFPFTPSTPRFPSLKIPAAIHLGQLVTKI